MKLLSFLAAIAFSVTAANAAIVQYDDRTAFEAASTGLTTDDLNDIVADIDLAGSGVVDRGDYTITGPSAGVARIDAGGDGVTPVDGTAYVQGIGAPGSSITFDFVVEIFSFGVDLFGVNNDIERTRVVVNGTETLFLPVVAGDVASFLGITSDTAITSVAFELIEDEDAGLDNITYGGVPAIPLPASGLLLIAGLGGLAALRRRQV